MSILTEEMEARLVALHDQGLSDRAVATEMGVSQSVVRVALYRAHRLPDHSIKRLGDKFDAVVTGWEDGLTVKELAGMAGISHDAMKWILVIMKAYGHIKPRKQTPHNKGKLMPMRKKHQVVFDKLVAVRAKPKLNGCRRIGFWSTRPARSRRCETRSRLALPRAPEWSASWATIRKT